MENKTKKMENKIKMFLIIWILIVLIILAIFYFRIQDKNLNNRIAVLGNNITVYYDYDLKYFIVVDRDDCELLENNTEVEIKNKLLKSKSKVYFKNFKKVDLSEYNVIFCYLLDYYLNSLKQKFDKELKPGTKIISYGFPIKNWHKPEKLGRMFVYRI